VTSKEILEVCARLVAKAEREYHEIHRNAGGFCQDPLFLYYKPSTETEAGDVTMAADCPAGYQLASTVRFSGALAAPEIRVMIRSMLRNLPILPHGAAR